jgi:hypothetical protein
MSTRRLSIVLLGLGCLAGSPTAAAPPRDGDVADALALAARIDARIVARWPRGDFRPAPAADDAEFLRRVWLDVAGRIPPAYRARDFLEDPAPDKRRRVVEELLCGPDYVTHFTNVWADFLLAPSGGPRVDIPGPLHAWLARRVRDNAGYDRIVRELLASPLAPGWPAPEEGEESSPAAFYDAQGPVPEKLAAATARLFLGLSLECAQCHDHPFAPWKRRQFWELAAFFADTAAERRGGRPGAGENAGLCALEIPDTGQTVRPRFPGGNAPRWRPGDGPRAVLAGWVAAPDNPFFARAAVNRLWAHFFGTELVDEIDAAGEPAADGLRDLLDDLAREFTAHGFDVKFLIRAVTASHTYQRSSRLTHPAQADPRLCARMAVRGLSPEQLAASLIRAAGCREERMPRPGAVGRDPVAGTPREQFRAGLRGQANRVDSQTSVLQALLAMNGALTAKAVGLVYGETVTGAAAARGIDTAGRIEQLFLAALSRKPRPEEVARLARYVDAGGPRRDVREALADVFWALLNSSEFMLNH